MSCSRPAGPGPAAGARTPALRWSSWLHQAHRRRITALQPGDSQDGHARGARPPGSSSIQPTWHWQQRLCCSAASSAPTPACKPSVPRTRRARSLVRPGKVPSYAGRRYGQVNRQEVSPECPCTFRDVHAAHVVSRMRASFWKIRSARQRCGGALPDPAETAERGSSTTRVWHPSSPTGDRLTRPCDTMGGGRLACLVSWVSALCCHGGHDVQIHLIEKDQASAVFTAEERAPRRTDERQRDSVTDSTIGG
jgi:hypothetical protein